MVLVARSLRKAVVPSTLIENPSGNLQSTRLAPHIPMDDSPVSEGKESLLIPIQAQVMGSSLVNRCPHRSEVHNIVLFETESPGYLVVGSVDCYGHLIVSKLDIGGKDIDQLAYLALPQDSDVGEGSWAGLCFSPSQCRSTYFCKSISVYYQDILVHALHSWLPISRWAHCSKYEITGLAFSSLDPDYIYIQGVYYEEIVLE